MVFFFYSPSIPDERAPIQFLISVPKRTFRKATIRNYVKRQIREAVRKQKPELYQHIPTEPYQNLAITIIYTGKGLLSAGQIEASIKQLFQKFEYRT